MFLCSLVLSGLLLLLLSAEAKPLTPSNQDPAHVAGEQSLGTTLSEGWDVMTNVSGKVRLIRNAVPERRPRRENDKPRNRSKKKGCFRLRMDKIGAMSKLGC